MAPTATSRRSTRTKKATAPARTAAPKPSGQSEPVALRPEPYLVHLDPRELLRHPSNPRRDYGDLTEVRQTITAQGLIQALTVIPDDKGYRVVAGHRRAAAAAEALDADEWPAGMQRTVPCMVRPDLVGVPVDQIISMLVENDHRKNLTTSEQAAGYAQLAMFEVPPEEIARRTGRTVKHVTASLKLHSLGDDMGAKADKGHITLEDVAVIDKEFADNPKAVERILKGSDSPWGVRHNIDQERRKSKEAKAAEEIRQQLKADGVKELPKPKGWPYECAAANVDLLLDANGDPVDRKAVQAIDGFGAFIEKQYGSAHVTYICLKPKEHGMRRRNRGPYVDPEEREAERREEEARQQALTDAQDVREKFLVEKYGTVKATKVLLVDAMRVALTTPTLLDRGDDELVRALAGGGDINDVAEAKIDRLNRLLVAQWIAGEEEQVQRAAVHGACHYGVKPPRALAWLDRLVGDGYELSAVERTVREDLAAEVAADEQRQDKARAAQEEAEARRAAAQTQAAPTEDELGVSRFSLFHVPADNVWVLSHDDSGQPMGELAAGPDEVERAQQWADGLLVELGLAAAGWRREHDDDANADYYVTEPVEAAGAEEEPGVTETPAVAEEESVIAVAEVVPTGAPAEGQGVER